MSQPSGTNIPRGFPKRALFSSRVNERERVDTDRGIYIGYLGGNSDGDPPLTIPNREVKPINADGTA